MQKRRRWRFYVTSGGNEIVKKQLAKLSDEDAAELAAALAEVRHKGRSAGRHLRGDVYEVKADTRGLAYRLLFAAEGEDEHVLLGLEFFSKKTRKTPKSAIDTAEKRLKDWRARGAEKRRSPSRTPNPRGRR